MAEARRKEEMEALMKWRYGLAMQRRRDPCVREREEML
jgi:hypothetical protein